jgi:ATP-binding cassette subfamily F protein 3
MLSVHQLPKSFGIKPIFNQISFSINAGDRAALVVQECNLLLLDEPLNHLDIPSRTRFEQALTGFEGTILAVAHDRYFLERFAQLVWEIKDGEIVQHYQAVMV